MSTLSEFTIAITATFTAEPLEESLRFWGQTLDIPCQVQFAPYNQVFQQLLDPSSLLSRNQHGVNVVLVGLEDWLKGDNALAAIDRNLQELALALKLATERSTTPYLVCFCPPAPASPESNHQPDQAALLKQVEDQIVCELNHLNSTYLITSSDIATTYPVSNYYDLRGQEIGHIPFTPAFFAALGTSITRKIHSIQNRPYKVIVLDCDQTLWKGVCGEEGALGIEIDPPRRALQEFMVAQHNAGMLICLCSKNSEDDVIEVFDRRSDMPLKREHIVSWRINWQNKSENIKSLAHELQLGLDSFIFIDDNPIECAEVQTHCPEVLTLQLPEAIHSIPQFLQHIWAFDHLKVTEEDKKRTVLYQQNIKRERLKQESLNIEEFLANLHLKVKISELLPEQISRASQLTLRTNQFNMTTIRRSEGEMQRLLQSENYKGLVVEVSDRFGEYGLVGLVIYQSDTHAINVDTFLLSCRVLGRGVEHQVLTHLGTIAQANGLNQVNVSYKPTKKNQPALDFLESAGAQFKQPQVDGLGFSFPVETLMTLTYQPSETRTTAAETNHVASKPQPSTNRIDYCHIATQLYDAAQILAVMESQKRVRSRPELQTAYTAPRNPLEQTLATLWQDVLSIKPIGIHDNFFECGGDSLQAAFLITKIGEKLNEFVYAVALFDAPTIAEFAAYLKKHYAQSVARVFGLNQFGADGQVSQESQPDGVDETKVARMRQLVKTAPPLDESRLTSKNPPAVFILSPPRSGSTLLRVMLAGHPQLFAPPELHLLGFDRLDERRDALDRFWSEGIIEAITKLKPCSVEEAKHILEDCENQQMTIQQFYQLLQSWTGTRKLVDKTPIYALDPSTLKRAEAYFDQALYIHLLRHPYGMIKSFEQAKLDLAHRYDYPFTRRELAELIWLISHQNILDFLKSIPAERQHKVKYEDVVKHPQQTLEGICHFLNLEFHPDTLEIHSEKKDRMTKGLHSTSRMLGDMKFLSHKGINSRNAESWKDYFQDDFLGDITWQVAAQFGYDQRIAASPQSSTNQRLSPIVPIQKSGSKRPIFYVHPVGGSVLCYASLAFSLGLEQPFYALQAPGLTGEREPYTSISEMAAYYNQALREIQPQGPYLLGGWSMGGVVAMEMAQQLLQQGEQTDLLVLIDSRPPGFHQGLTDETLMFRFARDLWRLSNQEMPISSESLQPFELDERLSLVWREARAAQIIPSDMDLQQLRYRWQVYRANMQALQSYVPKAYSGRMAFFYSRERSEDALVEAWHEFASGEFETYMLPCDHYTIIKEPHVHELSKHLKLSVEQPIGV